MESNFNKEKILEVIKIYLKEKNVNGAILIDGEWGVGKTYFIEKELINKKKEYVNNTYNLKDILYVSLYGVTNIADIEKKIFRKIIPILKTDKKIPAFLGRISSEIVMKSIELEVGTDIEKPLNKIIDACINLKEDYSKYLIIFDDLERCDIPLNTLLGYINQLVEHEKQKIIIVTNEEAINKNNLNKNKELKYISMLNLYKSNIISKIEKESFGKKEEFKIDDEKKKVLDDLVNDMYGINNHYNEIKEKLIYQTIKYESDKKEIFQNMIESLIENTDIKKILNENLNEVIEVFNSHDYFNIRTMRHLIIKLKSILESIDENNLNEYKENDVIKNIVLSATKIIIDIKKENKDYLKLCSEKIVQISLYEDNIFFSKSCTKSIIEFLTKSYINKEELNEELELLNEKFKVDKGLIPYDWNRCSDEYLKENFIKIKERVQNKDDKINANSIKSKFDYFYMLYEMEIIEESLLDEFIVAIGDMIKSREYEYYSGGCSYDISTYEAKFKEKLELLNSYEYKSFETIVKGETIKILQAGDVKAFIGYLDMNSERFLSEKGFLKCFSIDDIMRIYLAADNKEKDDIDLKFGKIYKMNNVKEFFEEDKLNMKELVKRLKEEKDKVKGIEKYNMKCLINRLENKLKNF